MRRAVRALLLGLLVAAGGCATGAGDPSRSLPTTPVGLRFMGYDGSTRSLAALRGRPVVVEVVATWAGPALVEVERLRSIQAAEGDRIHVVILVLDPEPQMAAIFAETFEIPEAVGRVDDVERFVSEDGPFGPIGVVPTGILLGSDGRILLRSDGPWPPGVLERALARL